MTRNIGKTDRIIRYLLGLTIAAMGVYFNSWWGLVGLVPFFTGVTLFCPIYKIFGLNTYSTKSVQ